TDDAALELALGKSDADPVLVAAVQKSRADAAEATEIAKHERELRVDREMLSKAEELTNLQGTPVEKAEVLKAAYGVSTEVGDKMFGQMTAANRQLADAGELFTAVGKSAPGQQASTHAEEAMTRAQEMVKADPKLTIEKAVVEVYKSDPGLYNRQMKEEATHG